MCACSGFRLRLDMNFQILQGGSHSLFSSSLAWGYQVGGGVPECCPCATCALGSCCSVETGRLWRSALAGADLSWIMHVVLFSLCLFIHLPSSYGTESCFPPTMVMHVPFKIKLRRKKTSLLKKNKTKLSKRSCKQQEFGTALCDH